MELKLDKAFSEMTSEELFEIEGGLDVSSAFISVSALKSGPKDILICYGLPPKGDGTGTGPVYA